MQPALLWDVHPAELLGKVNWVAPSRRPDSVRMNKSKPSELHNESASVQNPLETAAPHVRAADP